MNVQIDLLSILSEYAGIFILMLSTFLIGYFACLYLQKAKYIKIITKQNKKIAALKKNNHAISNFEKKPKKETINDLETIFSEIKPKIIKVVKEAQEEINETNIPKRVALKARTSYVSYNKSKAKLNLENLGYGDKSNKDDLTKITGIGPYIEERLNEVGIFNYVQISKLSIGDIRSITDLIDFFPGRIENDDWIGQATESLNVTK
ncbi:MAG: putative flap endonuclease-1-like 5' DNA nuclease [Flavobacteriaceae bacterium]|jgi:predicted flap endonuclease-1-like 5' DNA nuclease|uniref:hypothetical protein n=1 Tax=Candidatus Marifrigoribacter sp. Uisw_064 TaxID=3230970 RepID=UPI003AE3E6F4